MTMERRTTLPASYYTDPGVFAREQDRFFSTMWVCVAREEDVAAPGDYVLRDVAGESCILTRDTGGALRAFYNVCRHRGTRLATEPKGRFAGRIQCPYHAWTYDLDGTARRGAAHGRRARIPVQRDLARRHRRRHLGRTCVPDPEPGPSPSPRSSARCRRNSRGGTWPAFAAPTGWFTT